MRIPRPRLPRRPSFRRPALRKPSLPRRPSGIGPLAAVGDRLRGARYFIADVAFVIARFPRAVGSGVAGFWRSLSIVARRRLVAAVGAVAAALLFMGLVVPNLPCELPGGDECPPDDDAIELAPAGAVAYVHANLDPETEQAEQATEIAGRMPGVSRQVIGQAATLLDSSVVLGAAAEPWFGGEAAAVVIGADPATDRVQLLETTDSEATRTFAESLAGGAVETAEYREVEITEDERGVAAAVVDGFLALGTPQGVRAVVDVATGAEGADSLADDATVTRALDELPDHRVAEAYLSADGIEQLITSPQGSLASFEPLINTAASRAAAIALSADDDGLSLATRSVLDSERIEAEPGFFGAFDDFEPELPEELAPDALAYVGLGRPRETVAALLRQATVGAPGIAAGITDLIESLRGAADVDLQRDLLDALGGEGAFTVVPREALDPDAQTVEPTATETPYLEFLADDVDEERAREALARLQGPIAESFDPNLGAPNFQQRKIGDVEAQVLRVSPVAQIIYGTLDSRLVIANDPAAVERLSDDEGGGLKESDRYEDTVDGLPDEPALLAYLDLRGLLSFAERTGLGEDPAYGAFAPDLRRLDSFAVAVTKDEDILEADARLLVD